MYSISNMLSPTARHGDFSTPVTDSIIRHIEKTIYSGIQKLPHKYCL